jgi:hypothetical protein
MPRTVIVPGRPPKWLALSAALVLLLLIFLGVYLGAAFLGDLICRASLRLHLLSTGFTCRYLPSILASIVYFAFLFSMPIWIEGLRSFAIRMYRLAFSGKNGDLP